MADASRITMVGGDAPPTPPTGRTVFYPKDDNNFYRKGDDGVERVFSLPEMNDPAKYVVYVDLSFETNYGAHRFNKIQDAINWIYNDSGWYSELTNAVNAIVYIYPGMYTEQVNSYSKIRLVGINSNSTLQQKAAYLYNTGADEAHYPIGFANDGHQFNAFGLNIRTDENGCYGKAIYMAFQDCAFRHGHFIEYDGTQYQSVGFRECIFFASNSTYILNMTGTRNVNKSLTFTNCTIGEGKIKIDSTYSGTPGYNAVTLNNTQCNRSPFEIGGDWDVKIEGSHCFSPDYRNIISTTGYVDIQNSVISNGIHFTSAPSSFTMLNSNFKDTEDTIIGVDEADITSDVTITNADYQNNTQLNGIDGKISITNNIKKVHPNFQDSYISLEDAIEAAVSGDIIQLDNGTFTGNFVLPDGVNLQGANEEDTILNSTSGTTLTLAGAGSMVSNLTIKTTPSGATIDGKAIQVDVGTHELQYCKVECNCVDTYGNIILMAGGSLISNNSTFNYTQTGTTTGVNSHVLFNSDVGVLKVLDSEITVNIADLDDNTYVVQDDTVEEVRFTKNIVSVVSASSGVTSFLRQTENVFDNSVNYNDITLVGPDVSVDSGTGYCYLIEDDSGSLSSNCNSIKINGFTSSYLGNIGANTTLKSHFDNIDSMGEVIGTGDYQYVNSPDPGDIRISGAYINMYDNELIVANRGGEFTSLKDAIDSITDATTDNRYSIQIHSGNYIEDNPIELKPYVYLSGSFKHTARIIPQNNDQHLFISPNGLCISNFGQLALLAPSGANTSIFYGSATSVPIVGFYACLLIGQGSNSNCIDINHIMSNIPMVDNIGYGEWGDYIRVGTSGGNLSDAGLFPESTTSIMDTYLRMEGPGLCVVDDIKALGYGISKLIYMNHAGAEIRFTDIYSRDSTTLTTGPLGGDATLRGMTFNGTNTLNGGTIDIDGGVFENDSTVESTSGNLDSLTMSNCKNFNDTTYCVKVTGGSNTDLFIGGSNIFKSPSGIDSVQLSGSFKSVVVEGVIQRSIASLSNAASETLTHPPDAELARMIQIQAYPSAAGLGTFDYTTEGDYIQEDSSKTDFISGGGVHLAGIGLEPYAWWHFNETGGSTVADSSGNSRTGTMNGNPSDWVTGHLNNCLKFDAGEYATFGSIASFERTDPFSLECWVYIDTVSKCYVMAKMEDLGAAIYRGYGLYVDNRYLYFEMQNTTGNLLQCHYNTQLTAATWYHVVMAYTGSSDVAGVDIYVNDVNVALVNDSDTLTGTIINTGDFQASGRDGANDVFASGRIDEAAVYDKQLNKYDTEEITYRYNTGTGIETMPGTFDTTESWYIITENSGGSRLDTSLYTNIGSMLFDEVIETNTSLHYLVSMDEGVTWYYWSVDDWVIGDIDATVLEGNTSTELEVLTETDWDKLFVAGTLDVAVLLETSVGSRTPKLNKIEVNYSVPGSRIRLGADTMKVEYVDAVQTKVTNISGGTLTGIKVNIAKQQPH